ncbi:hypothetical protein Vretimale_8145 [Volvox reticuliferus]|uniref:Uncharacterized protein n=1 Tax=Volvox reticuliferus TaxID=1737510 RepID=A0A8J4GB22_9CHLO|nr:hypothetical protein Vretifemale_20647 [Volvox reticuliferus]GIM03414.1 hypothetical protein Vretimale_8145 [Volvox reticuliferus]
MKRTIGFKIPKYDRSKKLKKEQDRKAQAAPATWSGLVPSRDAGGRFVRVRQRVDDNTERLAEDGWMDMDVDVAAPDAHVDAGVLADVKKQPNNGPDHKDVARYYLLHHGAANDVRERYLAAQRHVLKESVAAADSAWAGICSMCGSDGSASGALSCPVIIITWDQPILVEVPIHYCGTCRAQYAIKPTAVDCLPDTKPAWDLPLRRDQNAVVWWHQALLQQVDLESSYTRHVNADRFCAAMQANWKQNNVDPPNRLALSTLRKRLRSAWMTYHYLQALEDGYPEGIPGSPAGVLKPCPCCGGSEICRPQATAETSTGRAAVAVAALGERNSPSSGGRPGMTPAIAATGAEAAAGEHGPRVLDAAAADARTPTRAGHVTETEATMASAPVDGSSGMAPAMAAAEVDGAVAAASQVGSGSGLLPAMAMSTAAAAASGEHRKGRAAG